MRKVKIPTSMNPFVVHVNGEKYVYPAGTEQEVEDAVANVIDAYIKKENQQPDPTERPFSTSWNDLKDKPFGETTVKGDTLTWDGNTEGLVSIVDTMFKVSDTVLNYDDFADGGFEVNSIHGVTSGNQSSLIVMQEFGSVMSVGHFYSFSESAVGVDVSGGEGMIPPESGTYFTATMRSLTIPGYNGFETTTIQPIDAKYLPPLVSPSGKKFKLSVDDSGVLSATEV